MNSIETIHDEPAQLVVHHHSHNSMLILVYRTFGVINLPAKRGVLCIPFTNLALPAFSSKIKPQQHPLRKQLIKMDLSFKMIRDIPSLVSYHWKEGNINWPMLIYISLVHAAATYGVAKAFQASYETLMWAFILWPIR